ncbi:hypothetical protein [Streptomyces sp. SLBN-8D4]|uniref:hypothetical protein n=1 Tax=Streptomyces sp. SLBN-8D4 TaxID=3377728 RepID=UPI003C7B8AC3
MTATAAGPGRDRHTAVLPAPPRASGGQAGMACTAVARRKQAVTAVMVSSGQDRHAGLLPTPSGPTFVGRQTGITHTAVAHRATRPVGSGQ